MTVPPNPPPRPTDENPQHHDLAPHEPGSANDPTSTIPGPATDGIPGTASAPGPGHPEPPAPAPGPSYLSGIVTAGLAAICGAIFTSWAGVQGTVVGAMVGATIGSTVSEMVRAPLDALERRIIAAGVSPWRLRRDGVVKTVMTSPTAAQQAFGMVSRGAVLSVGATAIVGFLLAIGGVTAVESASGQPLAATLGNDTDETGTTISKVLSNPPAALAPAPSAQETTRANDGTVAGRSGGGMTAYPPTVPPGDAAPVVVLSPSPSPDDDQDNVAAAPSASSSPEAALGDAAGPTPEGGAPTPDASATPAVAGASPVAQVVTVVVTATATSSPTVPALTSATAQAVSSTPTATPTRTPTPTPTRTPTLPAGASTPSGSPLTPPVPPQT